VGRLITVRWFRIQKADIDPEFRELFEQSGAETMRAYVPLPLWGIMKSDGVRLTDRQLRLPLLRWLKEQYDRAERKETWSLTMEFAITVFVATELFLSIFRHLR
jgi:hypothetical protein